MATSEELALSLRRVLDGTIAAEKDNFREFFKQPVRLRTKCDLIGC